MPSREFMWTIFNTLFYKECQEFITKQKFLNKLRIKGPQSIDFKVNIDLVDHAKELNLT